MASWLPQITDLGARPAILVLNKSPGQTLSSVATGVTVAATASPLAVAGDGSLASYWRFHRAVATAQLAAWLPPGQQVLIDISGPQARCAAQAAKAGHCVLRVTQGDAADGSHPHPGPRRWPGPGGAGGPGGIVMAVTADPGNLRFLADGCADGVIADDRALSRYIAAEYLAAEIARVLRPGGRLIASVDSLVLGMAVLAEQRHWAELTDLPSAEVLLIPWPDGTFTRCYGVQHLKDLCVEAGLKLGAIRPRTVLSPSMVARVLRQDPGAMARLVRAELIAEADESFGIQLVVTARKPL
jgi:SAM-dependent methyltransferase